MYVIVKAIRKQEKEAIKPMLIKAGISPKKLKEPGKLRLASKKNKNKALNTVSIWNEESQ